MSRFEASSDTRFLSQEFSKVAQGDTITYEALSKSIGRDVRKHAAGSMQSALRMQLNQTQVFEAIPNVGYRRLTDEEIIKTQAAKGLNSIARTARRTARKVQAVEFDKLSNPLKTKHNTQLSMLGAVCHMSQPRVMAKLETKVAEKMDQLPIGETLALMTK